MIAPDFVLSEIHRRALGGDGEALGESPLQQSRIMTAERCAALMVKAMEKRRRLLIPSLRGKVGRWLRLLSPGVIDWMAARAILKKR